MKSTATICDKCGTEIADRAPITVQVKSGIIVAIDGDACSWTCCAELLQRTALDALARQKKNDEANATAAARAATMTAIDSGKAK